MQENRALEQFFWTRQTVDKLCKACEYVYEEKLCCLTTPSLAHELHVRGREETLLDIDTRFSYLPKFRYYDLRRPAPSKDTFRLLILDPPFFLIPIEKIAEAVDTLTHQDYSTRLIIGFIKRGECRLRTAFANYQLFPTSFPLEYASIKSNKWKNFCLYSNVDLPGIKRIIDIRKRVP